MCVENPGFGRSLDLVSPSSHSRLNGGLASSKDGPAPLAPDDRRLPQQPNPLSANVLREVQGDVAERTPWRAVVHGSSAILGAPRIRRVAPAQTIEVPGARGGRKRVHCIVPGGGQGVTGLRGSSRAFAEHLRDYPLSRSSNESNGKLANPYSAPGKPGAYSGGDSLDLNR